MLEQVIVFLIVSLAVASVTLIITRSVLFSDLRKFARQKHELLGELFSCPLCMGTWVSFLLGGGAIKHAFVISHYCLFNLIFYTFALLSVSSFFMSVIFKSISSLSLDDN